MRNRFTIAICALLLACASFVFGLWAQRLYLAPPMPNEVRLQPQVDEKAPQLVGAKTHSDLTRPSEKPLYLHWMTPAYVFREGRTPPSTILSVRVCLGEDISIALDKGHPSLKGRIDFRDGNYEAKLIGAYQSSTGFYQGEIQLDKVFQPREYFLASAVYATKFVLSNDPDGEAILKKVAEKDKGE